MVLGMFLEQHANTMSEEELAALVELLDYPDSDLWGVASGRSERYRGLPPIRKW